jgi:hypothetical protein
LENRLLFAAVVHAAAAEDFLRLEPHVVQFREALRNPQRLGSNQGRAEARGYREVTWDIRPPGLPDSDLVVLPGDYFSTVESRGLLLSTPGTRLLLSEREDEARGTPRRFQSINPTYRDTFEIFSYPRLFSPEGSTITDATFLVPGTDLPATVNAFGMVFTDVDGANTTTIEFFDPAGASLGVFAAPPRDEGLSFLGVRFDAGERVARARVTSGNTPLGPNDGGAAADVVVMDTLIFAEPQPNVPNLYRFDGDAGEGRWSDPNNWQTDVVPPPGSILEFPGTGGRFDLPSGTAFDSLLFTGGGDVSIPSGTRLGLRNGIRASGPTSLRKASFGGTFTLDLLGPQTLSADLFSTFHFHGEANLNGHDLTLGGAGRVYFFEGNGITAASGGRLIKEGTGEGVVHISSSNDDQFPREVVVNEGLLFFGGTYNPGDLSNTSVRVNGGTFQLGVQSIGPIDVHGGTLSPGTASVKGDLSLSSAATFHVTLTANGNPLFYRASVAGEVNLGNAALNVDIDDDHPSFYTAPPGDRYYLISNDGLDPISGTFRGIPEGGVMSFEGRLFRITYRGGDGNDVVMTSIAATGGYEYATPRQPIRVTWAPEAAPTSVREEDLTLVNLTTGQAVPASAMDVSYDLVTRTATWTFPGFPAGVLPDGNYRATVDPAAGGIGGPAGPLTFDFFVLTGDLNRNRAVDGTDFAILARNFGRSGAAPGEGDLNGDGRVDGGDFALLAGKFGKGLPPPSAAAAAVATATAGPVASTPAAVSAVPPRRVVRPNLSPKAAEARRNVPPTRRAIAKPDRPHRTL